MIRKNTRYFDPKVNKFVEGRTSGIRRTDKTALSKEMQKGLLKNVKPTLNVFPFRKYPEKTATYKHSGDIGDLIYSLPLIQQTGGGTLYLSTDGLGTKGDGSRSGFTLEIINYIKPLLEKQPYIKSIKEYGNERVTVDIDLFRKIDLKTGNLCQKILGAFSVPFCCTDSAWIYCGEKKVAKSVFARSFRYRNQNVNYAPFVAAQKDSAIFVGLKNEYEDFINKFGYIPFYKVKDMLEMAEIINGSEMFYGNQSSPMALAIGLGKNFTQEVHTHGPDCKFDRINAKYLH